MSLLRFVPLLVGLAAPLRAQPVLPVPSTDGMRVVLTHRAGALLRAPRWTMGPLIGRAGGAAQPDWDLTYVSGAVLLGDGRLVTLSQVGNKFFRFAPNGRGEKVLARQGAGPADLMNPDGPIAWVGDSVAILDHANQRVTWFDAQRGGVRTMVLPRLAGGLYGRSVGALRSGAIVGIDIMLRENRTDSIVRQASRITVLDTRAASGRVVATVPGFDLAALRSTYRGRARLQTVVRRFSRVPRVVAWDTLIATASGDAYAIDLRDATGRVRATISVPGARRRVTPAMRDAELARVLKRFTAPAAERMVDKAESIRLERSTPSADSLPGHDALLVSRDQLLWVVDARGPLDTGGAATAFRADGAIVGRLTWKGNGVPVAFGADRVVMRELDEDDVVSLSIYRLLRR